VATDVLPWILIYVVVGVVISVGVSLQLRRKFPTRDERAGCWLPSEKEREVPPPSSCPYFRSPRICYVVALSGWRKLRFFKNAMIGFPQPLQNEN
jgi:hypothetical protein